MKNLRINCAICVIVTLTVILTAFIGVSLYCVLSSTQVICSQAYLIFNNSANMGLTRQQLIELNGQTDCYNISSRVASLIKELSEVSSTIQSHSRVTSQKHQSDVNCGYMSTSKYSTRRGTRAGRKKQRPIQVVISDRKCHQEYPLQCDQNSDTQKGTVFSNLVQIPLQRSNNISHAKKLSLGLVNSRSVRNKTAVIMDYVADNKIDLCFFTETWLNDLDNVHRASFKTSCYDFCDYPRQSNRKGGGIGILFRKDYKVSKSNCGEKLSFEFCDWLISWQNCRLRICTVYRPPYSDNHPVTTNVFFEEFSDYLESVVLCDEPLCILGDFNIHMEDIQNLDQNKMSEILASFGLQQHVSFATHQSGHTLDLIITRNCGDVNIGLPTAGYFLSDHCFVLSNLDFPKATFVTKSISFRKIKNMDTVAFKADLTSICAELISIDSFEKLVSDFNSKLESCLDKHAPLVTKLIKDRPNTPWFTPEIKDAKLKCRKAERTWREYNTDINLRNFQSTRNQYVFLLDHSVSDYYSSAIVEATGNQKQMYSIVDSLTNINRDNPLPPHECKLSLGNDFAHFFIGKIERIRNEIDNTMCDPPVMCDSSSHSDKHLSTFQDLEVSDICKIISGSKSATCDLDPIPTSLLKDNLDLLAPVITKVVNMSLQSGCFPDQWKTALVVPLLKKVGLDHTFSNYRPVSNLPFLSKVVEKAVISQLSTHMHQNCPLPSCQSAYRPHHSTESALIKVQSDILHNMENQKVTILVMIDLSAAFDTIDIDIMCDVLNSKFNVSDTVLSWFRSYLSFRKIKVNIDGVHSDSYNLPCGVPQGSCLGPILFIQYISTLIQAVDMDLHGYADDHQLYLAFSSKSNAMQLSAVSNVENCLCNVKKWMIKNKLKMNDSKTEFLLIGTPQQLAKVNFDSISVNGIDVKAVEDVRNLGAYFDCNMSMEKHIDMKCKAAFSHLYSIRKIRKYLTEEATKTLVQGFIFSHIDYCNGLLYGLPDYQIKKLQRIQNMAAKLVYKKQKFDHVTPLFLELHWLPVESRILYKVLIYTFKGIHHLAPEYICEMFVTNTCSYSLRSSKSLTLVVPRTKRKTLKDRSLPVAGPTEWNRLPGCIRDIDDFDSFKKELKTYLFKLAYQL